jgi:hypothetical protein
MVVDYLQTISNQQHEKKIDALTSIDSISVMFIYYLTQGHHLTIIEVE